MIKTDVNSITIFVSSSDAYADLWPAFFTLLKRQWPEFRGKIYLNTEFLNYSHVGLDITCTKLGKQERFGETFLKGLDSFPDEVFMLFMIDYFIEQRVDLNTLQEIYDIFLQDSADTFTLTTQPNCKIKSLKGSNRYCEIINRPSWKYMFSLQTAFWRKSSLKKLVAPWEDPWQVENFGSRRAGLSTMHFYLFFKDKDIPIKYDFSGVLHGGARWYPPALDKLDISSIPLDLKSSKRGWYTMPKRPKLSYIWYLMFHWPVRFRCWLSVLFGWGMPK